MLKMVDGTGIIGVDMVCPLGGAVSPPQPPNYDKVEVEGVGSLMLPNSLKAPLERLKLIGNSTQLITTGINLLPYKVGSKINSFLGGNTAVFKEDGIEITIKSAISTSDGDIYFFGNNKSGIEEGYSDKVKAGDYTILSNSKLCTFYVVVWRNGTSKVIIGGSDEQMIHFTVLDGDKIRLFLRVKKSIDTEKAQIMLCKHTDVNLPYEPYTGLKPSPSPECPQEIKNVGKWNEGTQKYEIDVKIANAEQNWSKEQTLTLTSDRPLTKWDKLVEQDGQIGWLYGSKIYVVTGNEVFESRDGYNIESYTNRFFILNDLLKENDVLKPLAYMKCLRNVQYVYSPNIFEEGFETNINQFHIKLSNDRVGILASDDHAVRTAKFSGYMKKIHKNGNPIEILYATTDTVFFPLSQEEQTQLRNLHSYNGTTNITVDSGEVPCGIKLTYRKEI